MLVLVALAEQAHAVLEVWIWLLRRSRLRNFSREPDVAGLRSVNAEVALDA